MKKSIGFHALAGACLVVGALGLAACSPGKPDGKAANAPAAAPRQDQKDAKEVEKYNHYIDAANVGTESFAQQLGRYEERVVPRLQAKAPLQYFDVARRSSEVDKIKTELNAGLAMAAPMPALDQAAKDYAGAMERLAPLTHELEDYASSKGYLADEGAKAREKGAAYLAALRDAVSAEGKFMAAVDEQDIINVKQSFDKQKEGTVAYFRAGLLYRAKLSMPLAHAFFANPANDQARAAFKASLDEVNAMLTGMEAKAPSDKSVVCGRIKMNTNNFLAAGREAAAEIKGEPKDESEANRLNWHVRNLTQDFNQMIQVFNQNGC